MHIRLLNEIDLDGQKEAINQVFPVEVVEKNDQLYLMFQNGEDEKVVLKCQEDEFTMTRFSNPKSIMRFVHQEEVVVTVPTPIGIQHFVTNTTSYQLSRDERTVSLDYILRPLDSDQIFATYKMRISWG